MSHETSPAFADAAHTDAPADRAQAAPLTAMWMLEAVQRIEADGPLEDAQALRTAFASGTTRSQQVCARAWLLGEQLGLHTALARWRTGVLLVALALAVLMAALGLLTARTLLAQGRTLNAVAACASLLALPTLSLAGLLLVRGSGAWLGRMAMQLAAKAPSVRAPHTLALASAGSTVLTREALMGVVCGALSHLAWALSLALTLAVLMFGFSFHAYTLGWESTLFGAQEVAHFVQISGALPQMLGFPVPDAAAVQEAARTAPLASDGQRAWAWWLMGCVTVYGLLPRVVLALACGWLWRRRVRRLQTRLSTLDLSTPYFSRIVARLDALEPPAPVIDPEQRPPQDAAAPENEPDDAPAPSGAFVVAFELPPDWAWPRALPHAPADAHFATLDGSGEARRHTLLALHRARPQALLLAVRAASSPDRGTARFLREAAPCAQRAALWLLDEHEDGQDAADNDAARWSTWLAAENLPLAALPSTAAAGEWIAAPPA
ncbi:MAG: DUF2868 domain-containing protein [Rhodocyclaceae bacterium]|nr:DUF2868 domain-containing protein [Rhodocyclaceae bacterium]